MSYGNRSGITVYDECQSLFETARNLAADGHPSIAALDDGSPDEIIALRYPEPPPHTLTPSVGLLSGGPEGTSLVFDLAGHTGVVHCMLVDLYLPSARVADISGITEEDVIENLLSDCYWIGRYKGWVFKPSGLREMTNGETESLRERLAEADVLPELPAYCYRNDNEEA